MKVTIHKSSSKSNNDDKTATVSFDFCLSPGKTRKFPFTPRHVLAFFHGSVGVYDVRLLDVFSTGRKAAKSEVQVARECCSLVGNVLKYDPDQRRQDLKLDFKFSWNIQLY